VSKPVAFLLGEWTIVAALVVSHVLVAKVLGRKVQIL